MRLDMPQSNQRGIETGDPQPAGQQQGQGLNRTSVGLKRASATSILSSKASGLNRTSVGLKRQPASSTAGVGVGASIEPAWD